MSLFDILTAAKPPYGTPPFAPPYGQSGGAQVPTTTETRPLKGFGGFLDRFANPTNALGEMGQALLAASGGPFGDAAQYLMKAQQLRAQQKAKGPRFEHIGNSFGIVDEQTGQFTPTYTAPEKGAYDNDLQAIGLTPGSPEAAATVKQWTLDKHDPIVTVPLANGGFANVPRSQIGSIPGMSPLGGGMSPPTPEAPPASSAAGGDAPAPPPPRPGGMVPRGLRNNNPLNLTISPFTRSQAGFTGADSGGRYATFDSPESGLAAARSLLGSYARRGYDTPSEIVNRWAPSAENGASTGNYVNSVARALGIGPNDVVPANRYGDLVAAMSDFENGRKGSVRVSSTPIKVASKDQYDRLPSGTPFIAPDGSRRVKP